MISLLKSGLLPYMINIRRGGRRSIPKADRVLAGQGHSQIRFNIAFYCFVIKLFVPKCVRPWRPGRIGLIDACCWKVSGVQAIVKNYLARYPKDTVSLDKDRSLNTHKIEVIYETP